MSIAVVIDMNLSPEWSPLLERAGWSAIHWSKVGDPRAPDREIMDWATANGRVVLTHDLDFGTILALTHKTGPSVLQVRGQDVLPDRMGDFVIAAITQHEDDLESGALVVVEEGRNRVRILPIWDGD
jgi:predicted nuclease of predicted toxin-antitoxin system